MHCSPNSADILLKNVIDDHDWALVRMNHQSAHGFIDEVEIIEIIGWISDLLEQQQDPKKETKTYVLYSRWINEIGKS